MKKLCLSVLAFLLVLTAAVPSFASEAAPSPEESPTFVETSTPEEAILPMANDTEAVNVTVPATGRIVINPYGLTVEIGNGTSTEQIAGETLTMINEGNTPVSVSVSAVGRVSELSSLTYAAQPPQEGNGAKEIFLYAEFQNEDDSWRGSYTGADNQVLISKQVSEPKEVLTLGAGTSQGVFRLFGATTVSPADPWCSDDAISVTLTFTFTALDDPSAPEVAAVEAPLEKPLVEEPAEEPTEEPTEEPNENPTVEPAGELVEEPETPSEEVEHHDSDSEIGGIEQSGNENNSG